MCREALAVNFHSWSHLFSSMLQKTEDIQLVICMSRESFLETLVPEHGPDGPNIHDVPEGLASLALNPTLQMAKDFQKVKLVFAPSLMHLRAYLGHGPKLEPRTGKETSGVKDKADQTRILIVAGLLHLHRFTSEFSAQGMSRTLGLAIEAAVRAGSQLRIVELRGHSVEPEEPNGRAQQSPWNEDVPLLNSSIRSGGDDRVWAGRSVDFGTVLQAWCRLA